MGNFAPLLIHRNKIKEKSVEIWIKTKIRCNMDKDKIFIH